MATPKELFEKHGPCRIKTTEKGSYQPFTVLSMNDASWALVQYENGKTGIINATMIDDYELCPLKEPVGV